MSEEIKKVKEVKETYTKEDFENLQKELNISKMNERILQETVVRLSMKLVGVQ